ncbi:MAG TPA: hypothetical protein VH643_22315 [Gemmataceae bacterium]
MRRYNLNVEIFPSEDERVASVSLGGGSVYYFATIDDALGFANARMKARLEAEQKIDRSEAVAAKKFGGIKDEIPF